MKSILFLIASTFLASCNLESSNEQQVQLKVHHHPQTAVGLYPQLVLLVQEDEEIGGESWTYFYDEIEGFEYEPGFIYKLRVSKTKVEKPPQDALGFKYELEKVISREEVEADTTFEIILQYEGAVEEFVTGNLGSGLKILDQVDITCQDDLCAELVDGLETQKKITGVFKHIQPGYFELVDIKAE